MNYKKNLKFNELFILLILLVGTNFCNLFSLNDFLGVKRDDLLLILILMETIICFIRYHGIVYYDKKFCLTFIFPLFLCTVASIIPNIYFGQSLFLGLRAQRVFMLIPLAYFSIYQELKNETIRKEYVIKMFDIISKIEILLLFVQCILLNKVRFLVTTFTLDIRTGVDQTRLRTDLILITIGFLIWLFELLQKKNVFKNVFFIGITLYVLIVYVRTRMLIIGYLAILIMAAIIWKPQKKKYKIFMLLILGIMALYLMGQEFFQYTLNSIFNSKLDGNLSLRASGRSYYLDALFKHPIFGLGYPHEESSIAYEAAGINKGYYLIDNGIFGFAYIYGIVGVAWLVFYWFKFLKLARLECNNKNYIYFAYMLLQIIICGSLTFFYSYGLCLYLWVLMTAMLQTDSKKHWENDLYNYE